MADLFGNQRTPKGKRETQISEGWRIWKRIYPESEPPAKQLAHYAMPFLKAMPPETVWAELEAYLRKTPQQFVSLHRWSMTFGTWAIKPKTVSDPPQFREVFDGKRMRLVPDDAA